MKNIFRQSLHFREISSATLSVIAALCIPAYAHSDPFGDIHPVVKAMDGKFSVVFRTQLPGEDGGYTDKESVSRVIYNADGSIFAPRHPMDKKRDWRDTGIVNSYGGTLKINGSELIFSGREGKPGYILKAPAGERTSVRLPWPDYVSLTLFENAIATDTGVAISGKDGFDGGGRDPLKFYWFPFGGTEPPVIHDLGRTACIYHFPVASNIAFAGGKFWIAFMQPTGEGEDSELQLVMWSWKPGDKKARVEILDSPAFWNADLSLAASGNRLCLAYHCPDFTNLTANDQLAKIVTVFRDAD
jgi:hypothetical protein